MAPLCRICRTSTAREDCYVRLEREDHPACRACWERLFLDTPGAPPAAERDERDTA